jgi:hypothetical protein
MKLKNTSNYLKALAGVSALPGKTFAYAVKRNKAKLTTIDREINAHLSKLTGKGGLLALTGREEFLDDLKAIYALHAHKDENGNTTTGRDGWPVIDPQNQKDFDKQVIELSELHANYVESVKRQQEGVEAYLEGEAEFAPHKVKFDAIPETISEEQLTAIEFMIDAEDQA